MNTAHKKELQAFMKLLNEQPDPETLQEHEGFKFVPIEIVEQKLTTIFNGLVQYEIMRIIPWMNECIMHVRIRVFHPVICEWMNFDGAGAGMFEQKPSTSVKDFHVHKKANGARMTVPLAYAEAVKVAAKKMGNCFGANINRNREDLLPKDESGSKKPTKKAPAQLESETITHLIQDATSIEQLTKIEMQCDLQEEHVDLFIKKKEELLNPKTIVKQTRTKKQSNEDPKRKKG